MRIVTAENIGLSIPNIQQLGEKQIIYGIKSVFLIFPKKESVLPLKDIY